MIRRLWIGGTALAAACARSGSEPAPVDARIERVLNGLRPAIEVRGRPTLRWTLAARERELRVPAVSIAVIDSGRIAWTRTFGLKEVGRPEPVTPQTLFQAASISKPITATAMLRLVEAGKLDLDTDVSRYLRSWQLPSSRFTAVEKVTLRRLASHSAGINGAGFLGYTLGDSIPTLPQVLSGIRPATTSPVVVDTFPGAIWRYASGGTLITQQVLMDVTGEPFPELMKRLVLDPAGMTSSTFDQPLPESRRSEAATGHDQTGTAMKGKWPIHPELAAGGLWTTPTDLARWAIAIADAWAGRSKVLLSQPTARTMLTIQKTPLGIGPFLAGEGRGFHFSHSGSNRGFRCGFIMFPAVGQGAVVMTNGDQGGGLVDEIFLSIAAEYHWPDYAQRERNVIALDSVQLDGLVGTYELSEHDAGAGVRVFVTREGNRLFLAVPPFVPKEELLPATTDSFFSLAGSDIVFRRDRRRRATTVTLGGTNDAKRLP